MQVVAEFTIEPAVSERPGPQLVAAVDAIRAAGFEPEMGANGGAVTGELELIAPAMADLLRSATRAGAMRIEVQLRRLES